MANRQINDNNTVTQVAQPEADKLAPAIAEIGQQIIKRSQEAKITENLSAAQLEIGQLSNDYQTKYENDPFNEQGLKEFRTQRQGIIDKYGSEGISPLFGRTWKDSASRLSAQNDLTTQAWSFKQGDQNTKQSIINTNKYNLVQTGIDGENYANGHITLPEALLNIHNSLQAMNDYGGKYLGVTSTDAITHDLGQDHIKTFISSVAKVNPAMALKLMDNEGVRSEVTNQEEWASFRSAVETRALNTQEVAKQQEILNAIKNDNTVLSTNRVLTYAEIQQSGLSDPAKDYFLRINGYKKEGEQGGPLSPDQKFDLKAGIFDEVARLSQSENVSPQDVQTLQGAIYTGMKERAITRDEGAVMLENLVAPAVAQTEKNLAQYSAGQWNPFKENVGFKEVQKYYDDNIALKPGEGQKKLGKLAAADNATRKANLYDNYWNSLQVQAAKKGVSVAQIPSLPDKDKVYSQAQADAIRLYKAKASPVLKVQPEIPLSSIQKLLESPDKAGDFDKKYGTGAANRILGK